MEILRATETWQQAGAYYVRIEAMVKGFNLPMNGEFDEHDTPSTHYVVVLDEGLPIATCRLFEIDKETAKIERVAVLKEYRKKGIGKFLIEGAEEWLQEEGYKKIVINSRDEAVGFYERLGYIADYNRIDEGGVFTCIYTEKSLTDSEENLGKVSTSEAAHEIAGSGAFVRQENRFVTPFGNEEGQLPVEANRYRLIWTPLCPWATRQVIAFKLLGLEEVISVGKVAPVRTEKGWEFSLDEGNVDPILGIRYLPEIYAATDPEYTGRATVPTVVDVKTKKVVNNDYHHLTNYWETVWKPFHKQGAPDLYPEHLRKEIDELNNILFHEVNNGVYKAGFAKSQEEYEKNFDIVYRRLDWLEERLDKSRYLFGDALTDSDIRLYVTLIRFDVAYVFSHNTNLRRIRDYENLWNYTKDLYSIPAFRETTDFDAIKRGYLTGDKTENPYNILPLGPDVSAYSFFNNLA